MAKDPAFLFYSKDWLEGTAEMTSEEKGIYIDLLAHQHQKGDLPADTKRLAKLSGLSEADFLPIWIDHLESKFEKVGTNRLVNRKLNRVVGERLDRAAKNKVVSALAVVVKKCKRSYADKFEAKKDFDINDFLGLEEPILTETVSKWFTERLPFLEDVNEDVNVNANVNKKGGVGENKTEPEKPLEETLIPKMKSLWMKANPGYPKDEGMDYPAYLKIAQFIAGQNNEKWNPMKPDEGVEDRILSGWEHFCQYIPNDSFFKNYSLGQVAKYIQSITQKFKDGKDGSSKKPTASDSRMAKIHTLIHGGKIKPGASDQQDQQRTGT